MSSSSSPSSSDESVEKIWNLSFPDGNYKVEFEHGTVSGKRVLRVNNKELMRNNWMFRLIGEEVFKIGPHRCVISIEISDDDYFEYLLTVDDKPYEKFCQNQSKILLIWQVHIHDTDFRVVLVKNTFDIWINDTKLENEPEFIENGTETNFKLLGVPCRLVTVSSGQRRTGLVHSLFVKDQLVQPQRNNQRI